mmetsp:Transcript_7031/g.26341  ORF Transcript_7031/g.26341 Transcript_7031/m.26341 type:complete len:819 (-) Transcript_7031:97-2553(-)
MSDLPLPIRSMTDHFVILSRAPSHITFEPYSHPRIQMSSSNTNLSAILQSPQNKIASLLQSYIDKHPNAIPKKHVKTINSALLSKLHRACQSAMKAKNAEHLLSCIKTIGLLADKKDMRTKLIEIDEMRDFICIIVYQFLHAAFARAKRDSTKQRYSKCLVEWLSIISSFSSHGSIVEVISEKSVFTMLDLLFRSDLPLELRRELSECLVHLVQHKSKKLSHTFFANSQWKNYIQRLLKQLHTLGDISSQMFYLLFVATLIRDKKPSSAEVHRWFPLKELADGFEQNLIASNPPSLRQAVFDYVIEFNAKVEQPTVFSFEVMGIEYGSYQSQIFRPHIHFGNTSLLFEMNLPNEKEETLLEVSYANLEVVAIHATSEPPRISVKLLENEEPELGPYFSSITNEVVFQMKERESLRIFRDHVVDNMTKASENLLVEETSMLLNEDDKTNLTDDAVLRKAQEESPPLIQAKRVKKFSSTPKVAVPRRQVYSEKHKTVDALSPSPMNANEITPIRGKISAEGKAHPPKESSKNLPRLKIPATNKETRRQEQDVTNNKENVAPLNFDRMQLDYDSDDDELKDWDKIAAKVNPDAVLTTRFPRATIGTMEETDEIDSNFGDLAPDPKYACLQRSRGASTIVTGTRKRKRDTTAPVGETKDDLHSLFEQVHEAIEHKRAKRRKLIDSLGQQANHHVDQKIEDAILKAQNQKQELEADYKEKMSEYRNQISSITSEMRAGYSKFQTLLKSKTKTLNNISKHIDQTKKRFEDKLTEQSVQASEDLKKLEQEVQHSLEQYQEQVESMKAVGDNALKEVLSTFISSFE